MQCFQRQGHFLRHKELDSAKHSSVIALFNQHFVKTGIVDKSMGRILENAKDIRENSDYGDFVIVTKEETEEQIKNAEKFLTEIEKALN